MEVPAVQSPSPQHHHHNTFQHRSSLPADPAVDNTTFDRSKWCPGDREGGTSGDGPLFSSMVSSPPTEGGCPRQTPSFPSRSSSRGAGGQRADSRAEVVGEVSVIDVRPSHWYNVRHRFSWRAIGGGFEDVEEVTRDAMYGRDRYEQTIFV